MISCAQQSSVFPLEKIRHLFLSILVPAAAKLIRPKLGVANSSSHFPPSPASHGQELGRAAQGSSAGSLMVSGWGGAGASLFLRAVPGSFPWLWCSQACSQEACRSAHLLLGAPGDVPGRPGGSVLAAHRAPLQRSAWGGASCRPVEITCCPPRSCSQRPHSRRRRAPGCSSSCRQGAVVLRPRALSPCQLISFVSRPPDLGGPPPRRAVLSMSCLSHGVIRLDAEEKLSVLTVQDVGQVMPGGEVTAGDGLVLRPGGSKGSGAREHQRASGDSPCELGF